MTITITNPFTSIYEAIMNFIYDTLLDDQWVLIAPGYEPQARRLSFMLAFVITVSTDDAATVASGKRKR